MIEEVRDHRLPFDSTLDVANGTLTLEVHAQLLRAPPGTHRKTRSPSGEVSDPWPTALWAGWPRRWRDAILAAWNDKLELHAASKLWRATDPHRLRCRLEVYVAGIDPEFKRPGHLRAEVAYFKSGTMKVSSASRGGAPHPRSIDMWLDDRDVVGDRKHAGVAQLGAVHEFGHHLGLAHRCGTSDPYCRTGPRDHARDIMAAGNDLKPWHAEPWLRRLHLHRYNQDVNWWAVVRNGRARSTRPVRPGADRRRPNLLRQNAMKETAALDASDVNELLAPPPPGASRAAARRRGTWQSVLAGLGLPVRRAA